MNFLEYNKQYITTSSTNTSDSVDLYSTDTNSILSKTTIIDIDITSTEENVRVGYDFRSILPKDSVLKLSSIVFYGYSVDIKQFISSTDSIFRVITLPNKFSKIEMDIRLEYLLDNKLYKIEDLVNINPNEEKISHSFTVKKPVNTFNNLNDYLKYLENRIDALESKMNVNK